MSDSGREGKQGRWRSGSARRTYATPHGGVGAKADQGAVVVGNGLQNSGMGRGGLDVLGWGAEDAGSRSWTDHVKAIVKSAVSLYIELIVSSRIALLTFSFFKVVISLSGDALSNAIFLEATSSRKPLVVEIFPEGKFNNDNEFVLRALGIEYMGWQGTQ